MKKIFSLVVVFILSCTSNLLYGETLPIVLQESEVELSSNYLVRKIPAAIPFNQIAYLSYELRGNYGSIPSFSIATTGSAWFYLNSSMGGINITDSSVWTINYLSFHLDRQEYLDRGAIEFSSSAVFNDRDIVLVEPNSTITTTIDNHEITFITGKEYPVMILADNQGPFTTPDDLLTQGNWALPFECYLKINTSFGQDTASWVRNIKYFGFTAPYQATTKSTITRGVYKIDEKGVLHKNNIAFFPITLYQNISYETDNDTTIAIFQDYKNHGITGIHCNYETLPLAYAAGFEYNTVYWGTGSGPVLNEHIQKAKDDNPDAWPTVFALSFDNEYLKYYEQEYKDSVTYVHNNFPDKIFQQLLGNVTSVTMFKDDADIFGTYCIRDQSNDDYRTSLFENLNNLQCNNSKAASIIQINTGPPYEIVPAAIITGIANGGTQVMFWQAGIADLADGRINDIRTLPWYNELPTLRQYIDKMLDLNLIGIQPATSFTVTAPEDCRRIIKPLLINDINYLIITNLSATSYTFNTDYQGVNYTKTGNLLDIIDDSIQGTIDNDKIHITVPGYGYKIVRIEKETTNTHITTGERGIIDNALSFTDNSYVAVPASDALNLTDKLTIALWFKWNGDNGESQQTLLGRGNDWRLGFTATNQTTATLRFYAASLTNSSTLVSNIEQNRWYHLVFTYDGVNTKIYLDGLLAASENNSNPLTANDDIYIGSLGTTTYSFNGIIDELKIYDEPCSEQFIANEFITPRPIAEWKFDTLLNNEVVDSASHNLTAPVTGSTITNGINGYALQFTDNNYVAIPANDILTLTDKMSISLWFKWNGDNGESQQTLLGRGNDWRLGFIATNQTTATLRFYAASLTNSSTLVSNIEQNRWYHLVFTYDGTATKLYLDGLLAASENNSNPLTANDSIYIGSLGTTTYSFNGVIDDLKIYNSSCNATFIAEESIARHPVAAWDLETITNSSTTDSGPYNLDATTTGVSTATGIIGNAMQFTDDSYITIPANSIFDITDKITISLWFKWNGDNGESQQILLGRGNDWRLGFIATNQTTATLRFYAASLTNSSTLVSNIEQNRWYHLVFTYDGTATKLYLDGLLAASENNSAPLTITNDNIYIGSFASTTYSFNGVIDEVKIFNTAGNAQFVAKEFYNSFIKTFWTLDTIINGKVSDSAYYNLDAELF